MEYLVICLVSLAGSALTLFSGFGLGTLLTPVFAIFFPIELAIAMTAIVHFLNNIFKFLMLGRHADKDLVIRFGVPSLLAAFVGAWVLTQISGLPTLHDYTLNGKVFSVTPVKLTIALLLIFFVLADVFPWLLKPEKGEKPNYVVGGLLSGFFGGLSGNQGALRSAFLVKAGVSKETFIATGIIIACMVDVSRLAVYNRFDALRSGAADYWLIAAAVLCAFAGAYLGNIFLKKVTIAFVQKLVTLMLLVFAILLGVGIL